MTNQCGCTSASDCPVNQACNLTTHTCSTACDTTSRATPAVLGRDRRHLSTGHRRRLVRRNRRPLLALRQRSERPRVHRHHRRRSLRLRRHRRLPGDVELLRRHHQAVRKLVLLGNAVSERLLLDDDERHLQPRHGRRPPAAPPARFASRAPAAPTGHVCLATKACGCTKATDCPSGQACNTSTGACTTSCNSNQACNGGCCSSGSGGTCQGGGSVGNCGSSGGVCSVCPAKRSAPAIPATARRAWRASPRALALTGTPVPITTPAMAPVAASAPPSVVLAPSASSRPATAPAPAP